MTAAPVVEELAGLRRLPLRPSEWTLDAACSSPDVDLAWWYSDRAQDISQARAVCAGCPVRLPCATGALERAESYGMWGGLDLKDRQEQAKRHGYDPPGRAAHATRSRYVSGCRCPDCRRAHADYEHNRRVQVSGRRVETLAADQSFPQAATAAEAPQETAVAVAVDTPPAPAVVEAQQPAPVIEVAPAAAIVEAATVTCPRAGLPWRPTRRRRARYHPLQLFADL